MTIEVDSTLVAEQLLAAEAKQAEKPRVDRPAQRPVTIFIPKGSRRPKPTQLESTFG